MDTYGNRDYAGVSPNLASIINMESNSNELSHTTYEDVITQHANRNPIDKNEIVTNMTTLQQVLPMSTVNKIQYLFVDNYDSMSVTSKYNANITPMMFWKNDTYLQGYETMFQYNMTGIMSLSSAMKYADSQQVIPSIVFP
jgi:hypothetical protein